MPFAMSTFIGADHHFINEDLSYNKFAGDLPSSFASLKNLTRLFLQNNEFTGSVVYLADLQLTDLNIQDNHFSGIIPQQFQNIPNLWIGGNKFDAVTNSPPWRFPFEKNPDEQNFTSPPEAESSAIEETTPNAVLPYKKKGTPPVVPGLITASVVFVAFGLTLLVLGVRRNRARAAEVKSQDSSNRSMYSIPVSSTEADQSPGRFQETPSYMPGNSPPVYMNIHPPPKFMNRTGRISFSRHSKMPPNTRYFTVAELQSATNNFSEENLLGEGSLGPVYKAKFPDGQIFAVKNITTVSLSLHEEDQFLDVVRNTSILKHPNIVSLVGYCQEHGQHLLVYEYVRDLTLSKALHSEFFVPLTWNIRIQIATGVAQALDYLHSLSPPMPHCNMKAANILLDDELMPHVCDSGLSVLRPLSRDSVKVKASEMAISDYGYIAPEDEQPGIESTKTDVYAYGVMLLELLTRKKPFDSSRPLEEQSLVQWASRRVHDGGSLEDIIDPSLRRSFSPKAFSRYADIVSVCVQPVKEFRPLMSEVVEALTLLSKLGTDAVEHDAHERSFRSTHTRFLASPAVSFLSGC